MKRIALLIIAMLTLGFAAQAQSTFSKGTTTANLGLGIGGTLFNDTYSVLLPPVSLGIDHSVCGYLGAEVYRYKGYSGSVWSQTLIGPRGSLHYQFVDKLDTYFSLMLGLDILSWNYNAKVANGAIKDKDTSAGFGWGAHFGTRYYLSDRWAIMGEFGYGLTYLTLGATYRF